MSGGSMNTVGLEQFLARIYVDPVARARFLASPREEAERAGLTKEQCRSLETIDRVGLEMAARSFAHKRAGKQAAVVHERFCRWRGLRDFISYQLSALFRRQKHLL
jgi:hypothetical protein